MVRFLKYSVIICFLFALLPIISFGQEVQIQNSLENQINNLEKQRVKDSLRIELLSAELRMIINKEKFADSNSPKVDSLLLEQRKVIDSLRPFIKGFPLVVGRDTLFNVYASLGPYTAKERVSNIKDRLDFLFNQSFFYPDSLKIIKSYNLISLSYQNQIILGITPIDALWEESDMDSLAIQRKEIITKYIVNYRNENSLKNNLYKGLEVLVIIGLSFVLVFVINKLFNYLKNIIPYKAQLFRKGIVIKKYELLKGQHVVLFFNKFLNLLKIMLFLLLFFIVAPIIFSVFPSTQNWSEFISDWFWSPLKSFGVSVLNYLPNLVKIALIILVARFILRLMRYFAIEIERKELNIRGFHPEWGMPTYVLFRFIFILLVIVLVFPYLPGSQSVAFKGMSVFLGVLISIGSSTAIANAIAGLVITYMRPFHIGDWIKTGEVIGVVMEKNALVTRLKTINNEDVTVPNSAVLSGATINYSSIGKTSGLVITNKVKIKYQYDSKLVESLLLEAAKRTQDVAEFPVSYVFQLSLEELYAVYELNAFTFVPDKMYFIKSDLVANIQNVFKEANIEIYTTQFVEIKTK